MDDPARCGIQARGVVCAAWSELPALRKDPGSAELAPHIRMSDDQTVLATVAVWRAIVSAGWQEVRFADWGVIAAPRFLGRQRLANACVRYRKHNLRGYSPLIIPHQSLHAVAGTLSIALKIHGPNFGIGGGPDHVSESLLTGLGMVQRGMVPGLWLVVTDIDSEPVATDAGEVDTPTVGHALALALMPNDANSLWTLELQAQADRGDSEPLRVVELADVLQAAGMDSWCGAVAGIGRLTIQPAAALVSRLAA